MEYTYSDPNEVKSIKLLLRVDISETITGNGSIDDFTEVIKRDHFNLLTNDNH